VWCMSCSTCGCVCSLVQPDSRVCPSDCCWVQIQVRLVDSVKVVTFQKHWSLIKEIERRYAVPRVCACLCVIPTCACRTVPYQILNGCSMDRLLVRQIGTGPMAAECASCWGGLSPRYAAFVAGACCSPHRTFLCSVDTCLSHWTSLL
jgi:hypothetical protein